jgi:calcineurin-like phosphoesterase family protein
MSRISAAAARHCAPAGLVLAGLGVTGACTGASASPGIDIGSGDGGAAVTLDAGKMTQLRFAVVGDSRPALVDDTAGYPSDVVTRIYGDVQSLDPRPAFVVSTGDYLFASEPSGGDVGQAGPQLDIYLQARARFTGPLFPALGNHECTGATASNCGVGAANGVTSNYAAFVAKMLAPIGARGPYFVVETAAPDRSWTAKLVFVAANAWSAAQSAWLDAVLARPTTYTFVVRHEPASATTAPGVAPSEAILARHPYTLAIVGHSHTYAHSANTPREVLVGNGGAPLTSKGYGFAVFAQRSDGAIVVDMLDGQTLAADASFHFAVNAAGAEAP